MAKVLTVSRFFPAYHPRKGQSTLFVEKILKSLGQLTPEMDRLFADKVWPKNHTIRKGNRWKVGDKASLRYWSDKPYNSPQVEFAEVEVVQLWNIKISEFCEIFVNDMETEASMIRVTRVAENDGLNWEDLINWFIPNSNKFKGFEGQIICWKPVNYI